MPDHSETRTKTIRIHSILCIALMFSLSVTADVLVIEQWQGNDLIDRPARGDSMQGVEQQFGQAVEEIGPVGTPPITRWVYQDFTVVFEGRWVISAPVPHREPPPESEEAPL